MGGGEEVCYMKTRQYLVYAKIGGERSTGREKRGEHKTKKHSEKIRGKNDLLPMANRGPIK